MTAAQITAAAILRTANAPRVTVKDRRGRIVGHAARNRYGLWEAFREGRHLPGSHLHARDAVVAVQES